MICLAASDDRWARQIKGLILASNNHVGEGVSLVGETGKALERIVRQVVDINQVITEIAASAGEQARRLIQVNHAVSQMDQATQENASMVEQSANSVQRLYQETNELVGLVAQFKLEGRNHAAPSTERSLKAA